MAMAAKRGNASLLPPDALIAIAARLLPSANDLCAMAATCSSWKSVLFNPSSPCLNLHTLHFLQANADSFPNFTQAISRSFPSTSPLRHLLVSFWPECSDGATFTFLSHHPFLESLTLIEQRVEHTIVPVSTLASENWRVFASLNHLSCLTLDNYLIDLDSGLRLEGDELDADVDNDRSGIKLAPENENVRLAQLQTLVLTCCDIDFGGLAVLLQYYCSPQALTLQFPFDEEITSEPHVNTMILDIYGPRLKYLNTVGPSIPHPHVLHLKAPLLQRVLLHNYHRVQFDLDAAVLESLTVRSPMDVYFESAIPRLHHLSVEGKDWIFEDLLYLFETCGHVKALHLDCSCDVDIDIEFLHTFVQLQSLFLGSAILQSCEFVGEVPLQLSTLQSLKLQMVTSNSEVQLLKRLLEAAPSLKSLSICVIEEETLGDVKALLAHYKELKHSFGY